MKSLIDVNSIIHASSPHASGLKHARSSEMDDTEAGDQETLEVLLFWGTTALASHTLPKEGALVVGDDPKSMLMIPSEILGSASWELAVIEPHEARVRVPRGAVATVTNAEGTREFAGGAEFATARGDRVSVTLGEFRIEISHDFRAKAIPLPSLGERVQRSAVRQILGAALLHSAFFGVFAYYTPALASDESASARDEQVALMRQYLLSAAIREPDAKDPVEEGALGGSSSGGQRARDTEGSMGTPNAAPASKKWGKMGPKDNPDPTLDRARAVSDARDFGMIGLLSDSSGDVHAPIANWGRDAALGADPISAMGNMWGADLGDAQGAGGLGLTGPGQGGGGHGEGVGIDGIGTLGHGRGRPGDGLDDGIGGGKNCPNCRLSGHDTKVPTARMAGPVQVNGHLPGEVIQRVVRANFGRFRGCYESGLRGNPALAGRVVARFAVDSQGMVSMVQDGGSSLPDAAVVACVIRSFYSLSFPTHEGGIVRVTYPLALSPE